MHHNPIPPVVLAAALSACSVQSELRNSERIEQRFGTCGIEVIEQDSSVRRSNLYSTENGTRICRTYALVMFVDPTGSVFGTAHQAVLDGQSIGTTFKAAGWEISKATIHVGELQVSDQQHAIAQLMHLDAPADLGLHAYQLVLEQGSQSVHYATIIESHHPSYLTHSELLELYPVEAQLRIQPDEINSLLDLVLATN